MRYYTIPLFLVLALAGCAGGGGGPKSNSTTYNPVPYYTPVRVGAVQIVDQNTHGTIADIFTQDLTGSGSENVIVAGRSTDKTQTSSNLTIFGWSNGQLVNQTSQWFSGTDYVVPASEPSVRFGDFLGNGKMGMYVAPSNDSESIRGQPGVVFINNGTNFTRLNLNLGNVWAHDSLVYDINRDGKADIFTGDYGTNSSIAFSNGNGTFTVARNDTISSLAGLSGAAAGDFLNNGTTSFIFTDSGTGIANRTNLMTWSLTGSGTVSFQVHSALPAGRFDLAKWDGYGFTTTGGSRTHSVRVLAYDFDNSGLTSAIVFSAPWSGAGQNYSEVQFLKNQGGGVFTDVTDNVLVGYNTATPVSYNPKLVDINGDGLSDIFLSGSTWTNPTTNTQVLIHTKEHKFVASHATVFTYAAQQSYDLEAIRASAILEGNISTIVIGPNNEIYIATLVNLGSYGENGRVLYLSKAGTRTVTAQATADAIKQTWPYMSDGQVNQVLATTSTSWLGFNIIDIERAFSPIGSLGLNINGRREAFTGYISGINLKASRHVLFDDIGRSFAVDLSATAPQLNNAWAVRLNSFKDNTRSAQVADMKFYQNKNLKLGQDEEGRAFTIGMTNMPLTKDSVYNLQYTFLPFSPFINMSGSWGKVNSSSTLEASVVSKHNQWINKAGLLYSTTAITPGIVQSVSPITSVWAESGVELDKLAVYGGIYPKVLSGAAKLHLPTSVDFYGNPVYNTFKAKVTGPDAAYARFVYNHRVTKGVGFRLNGVLTSQNRYGVFSEVNVNF